MILVGLDRTYPTVATRLADPDATDAELADAEHELQDLTLTGWARMSDASVSRWGDFVAGTYGGRIVSIYLVQGSRRHLDGRTTLDGEPAYRMGHLIGHPMPGGPWKRGEARGTRYVTTPYPRPPAPDLHDSAGWKRLEQRWRHALRVAAREAFPALGVDPQRDLPVAVAPGEPVVHMEADGTVVVTVPPGTTVLVRTTT